jgi:uncharacterized repeat protein (TIGR03803 family)
MKVIRFAGLALVCALATTMHAQSYKVLVNFKDQPLGPNRMGIIAQSRGGYLLSTAPDVWSDDRGVAFRVTTFGVLTVLHEFSSDLPDGPYPIGGLTPGTNGRFYGTTEVGGASHYGTIFEMTPDGKVKTLHEFTGSEGYDPWSPPIQSMAGDFYGTTTGFSGPNGGTVYRINSDGGDFTLLHVFTGRDGGNPVGPLVQATNDWFYGTTAFGGTHGAGTIFRISHSGEFEVLYNFDETHGEEPYAGLIQANDGDFYGTTRGGGAYGWGVVFRMTPTHQVTVLHDFTGRSDGVTEFAGLVQATDGYLYGTNLSLLFRISTTGKFTVLHNFQQSTGDTPIGLIQHTNGSLYGDTEEGGGYGYGVFYRYDLGLPPFVTYLPSYGRVGMTVDILGEGFTGDSKAFFNGVRAQIITVEPTYMRVSVPHGATSGWITVTTTKGTLKSNKKFLVHS